MLIFNKILIFCQNFGFWPKLKFFDQTFDFWPNFDFWLKSWLKIAIPDQNFYFSPKSRFLTKILIVFLVSKFFIKISVFYQNYSLKLLLYSPKLFMKISIFDQNFCFWPKFRFLTWFFCQDFDIYKNFYLSLKFIFLIKIYFSD